MKKFFLLACLLIQLSARAQVKIGSDPTNINGGSLLELEATNKGLVFPRVTLTSLNASTPLPAGILTGTVVFNTATSVGSGAGLYYWSGTAWVAVGTPAVNNSAWLLAGNSITASNFIGSTNAFDFVMRTNNLERMRILGAVNGSSQAGWIGMGIALPRSPVDMAGSFANKNILTIQNSAATGYSSIDMFDNSGTLAGTFGYANASVTNAAIAGKDYFFIYDNDFLVGTSANNNGVFYIQNGGNIGINNSAPAEKLDVGGNIRFSGALMPNNTAGSAGQVLTSAGAGAAPTWQNIAGGTAWGLSGNTGTNPANNYLGTSDAQALVIRTNSIERIRVLNNGNVGINNNNPGSSLDLKGVFRLSGSTSGFVGFQPAAAAGSTTYTLPAADGTNGQALTTNGNAVLSWVTVSGGGTAWSLTGNAGTTPGSNYLGTSDAKDLVFKANNTERIRILSGGNVGIGTTAPGSTLDVKGAFRLSGSTSGFVGFQSPAAPTASVTYTLPPADGQNGQVLSTNGTGTLSWTTVSGGGGGSGWLTNGNDGTTISASSFLGSRTNTYIPLNFSVQGQPVGYLGLGGSSYAISFGIGASLSATNFQAIAIGANAQAVGGNAAIAIGYGASAPKQNSIVLGTSASSGAEETISIGSSANSAAYRGIAIGASAQTSGSTQNIAIGYNANANALNGIAIGSGSQATTNNNTIALGVNAASTGFQSTALGNSAKATGQSSTAIGDGASSNQQGGLSFGVTAAATGVNAMAIGNGATSNNPGNVGSMAIGVGAQADGQGAIAMGNASIANKDNTTAYGSGAQATAVGANAFGNVSIASGTNSTTLGNNSRATATNSLAVGDRAQALGDGAISIGNNTQAGSLARISSNTVVIGNAVSTAQDNAFILGNSNSNVGIGTTTPNTTTKLDVAGAFKLGVNGTAITAMIDAAGATATIQGSNIANGAMGTATVTVTNALQNSPVIVSPRSFPGNPFVIAYARVTAANTVTIGIFNTTGSPITANSTFTVDVVVVNP